MVCAGYLPAWARVRGLGGIRIEAQVPSTRTRLLAKSRESLAPHESLQAVAAASAQVVSAVSVAATLTAGLSLGGAVAIAEVGWGWALPSILASALTVVLGVWATIPRTDDLHPGDLEDVDRFFSEQIRFRGRLLRAAGVSLCIAFVCIPVPFIAATVESPDPSLSLVATRAGGRVHVNADAEHGGSGSTLIVGLSSPEGVQFLGYALGEAGGIETSVAPLDIPAQGTIFAHLLKGREVILRRSIPVKDFASGRLGSSSGQQR